MKINSVLVTGKDIVHYFKFKFKMHFHYVLSMDAVFAMFAAWYFWVPKILGLNYNMLLKFKFKSIFFFYET